MEANENRKMESNLCYKMKVKKWEENEKKDPDIGYKMKVK